MSYSNLTSEVGYAIKLREFADEPWQQRGFIVPNFLSYDYLVNRILDERVMDYDEKNFQGLIGEHLSRQLLREFLSRRLPNPYSVRTLTKRKQGEHVLGSSKRGEVLKFDKYGKIVLLTPASEEEQENGFDMKLQSEVDGIIRVRRRQTRRKTLDEIVVVESKTGSINVSGEHIVKNILRPFSRIFNVPVHYILVGYSSEVFGHSRELSEKCLELYGAIAQENIKRKDKKKPRHIFSVFDFPRPFDSSDTMKEYAQRGVELQRGREIVSSGRFNPSNLETTLSTPTQTVEGLMVPKTHPRYEEIQRLLGDTPRVQLKSVS